MKSRTTSRFRKAFRALPQSVREQARKAYRLFQSNPAHPSLHFKRVHTRDPIYSARVNNDYRVLGVRRDDAIIWFWIGSHGDYEKLLNRL